MADLELQPVAALPAKATNPLLEIDWSAKGEVLNTRRSLARAFEAFLISSMGAGVVPAEVAQSTASLFVKMFENATTREGLTQALDTMNHEQNVLLSRFSLRVEEMKQKAISKELHTFLVYLVHHNQFELARELFRMYDTGRIGSVEEMKALAEKYGLKAEVLAMAEKLKAAKLDTQAEALLTDWENNRIQTEADLKPWLAIVVDVQTTVASDMKGPIIGLLAPTEGLFGKVIQKTVKGVYRLENNMRNLMGKPPIKPKS